MKKGKGNKDPWAALPTEFRDVCEQGSVEEMRSKLADIALANQELLDAQADDMDLENAKEAAKIAGEVYSAGFKENKLKVKFIQRILSARGAV